jgi:hypothetical protein
MPATYFGLDAEAWQLIFGAVQTLAVAIGVPYGIYQLLELRKERSMTSLEKMLDEWREDRAIRDIVVTGFPLGGEGTAPVRAGRILEWMHGLRRVDGAKPVPADVTTLLSNARLVVNKLNDLGSYVELGLVAESRFFPHVHYAIIRLTYVLEPYVLLRTALKGGNRWGMRLRRLRTAAERYHRRSPFHRRSAIRVRRVMVFTPAPKVSLLDRVPWRRLMPRQRFCRKEEEAVVASTQAEITRVSANWGFSFDEMDEWFGPT